MEIFTDDGCRDPCEQQGKKISYDIVCMIIYKNLEKKAQKLWEKYIESEEFDEQEQIYICGLEKKMYRENNYKKEEDVEYIKETNILNILTIYNKQEMLEKYCEMTIKRREGKILKELKKKDEDINMYLISVSVDSVDNPKYALKLIEKNPGKVYYMTYMLTRAYEKMRKIYYELSKDERNRIQKVLKEEIQLDQIEREKTVFSQKAIQIYLYTRLGNVETLYVYSVQNEDEYLQEKLQEKFEGMRLEEEKCAVCLESMSRFSTQITICEECQNYYHRKCTETMQSCAICRTRIDKK